MQYQDLGQTQYEDLRYQLLLNVEESGTARLLPYADGTGRVTIGIGFNLRDPAVRQAVLANWGVVQGGAVYNTLLPLLQRSYQPGALPASTLAESGLPNQRNF